MSSIISYTKTRLFVHDIHDTPRPISPREHLVGLTEAFSKKEEVSDEARHSTGPIGDAN